MPVHICTIFITFAIIGLNVVTLSKPGDVFSLEEIEEAIKKHKPTALFLTHAETITTVLQPLEGLGDLCHR